MGAGKRLTYYVEKQGLSKKKFCEEFSFEYNNMTSIMSEKRTIGINILDKIHYAFPKLNVHWLLYDEGAEEVRADDLLILNEPTEAYQNYIGFDRLIIKSLENENIKNKIHEIIQEKNSKI